MQLNYGYRKCIVTLLDSSSLTLQLLPLDKIVVHLILIFFAFMEAYSSFVHSNSKPG